MALGDIDLRFAAGVALGDIDVHSAWQAWHLWHWSGSGGAFGSRLAPLSLQLFVWPAWPLATSTFTFCGPSLSVAGVALGDIDVHSVGQEEHAAELVTIPNRTEITVKEKELRG